MRPLLPLLLLLASACSGGAPEGASEPAPAVAPRDLSGFASGVNATPPMRLVDMLDEATLELPASNLPQGGVAGQFTLDGEWRREATTGGRLTIWAHPSPVTLEKVNYSHAPDGMSMSRGGRRVPFSNLPSASSQRPGWDLKRGEVLYATAQPPSEWDAMPVLEAGDEMKLQARINLDTSGLEPAEYSPYGLTVGGVTRSGMLLPAPGRATWRLEIPEGGAELRTWPRLVPRRALAGESSDGVDLTISVNGEELESLHVEIDDDFRKVELDLSRWAGSEVELTFASAPGETNHYDHLFLGEPMVVPQGTPAPRRVIMVGIDTLRYDALTQHGYDRDVSESLNSFASQSTIFDRALHPAPRTRPSFRTALTGRYPLPAMEAPQIGRVMRDAGFVTAGVTANVHLVPRFGFNDGYDYWHYENGADAEVEIERAKAWLSDHENEEAFLFMHLMDPHVFYRAPRPYLNRYAGEQGEALTAEMNRWKVTQLTNAGEVEEVDKSWLRGRYDGEVAYMADQLAGFLAWVEELPGETLFVIHSDHGEEFWEHGGFEHNHTLYQELVHAMLWIKPPGGASGRVSQNVGTVDIVPTIVDFLGLPSHLRPETDGLSLAPLMDGGPRGMAAGPLTATLEERAHPIGFLMYDKERWSVVMGDDKYILQTWSGEEELYNLAEDPGEQNNLMEGATDEQLDHVREQLARATGWPVGEGWRVEFTRTRQSFELHFSAPVEAMILNPESNRARRANVEWGETVPVTTEDVGTLTSNEDGTIWSYQRGSRPQGTIAIRAEEGTTGELRLRARTLEFSDEPVELAGRGVRIEVKPGAVILPQDSVEARMSAEHATADSSSIEALRALGYVE